MNSLPVELTRRLGRYENTMAGMLFRLQERLTNHMPHKLRRSFKRIGIKCGLGKRLPKFFKSGEAVPTAWATVSSFLDVRNLFA